MIAISIRGAKRTCKGLVSASEKRIHCSRASSWSIMAPRKDQVAFSQLASICNLEASDLLAVSKLDLVEFSYPLLFSDGVDPNAGVSCVFLSSS